MLMASIAMPKSRDVQVGCDFLHSDSPEYAAGTPVRAIIVSRFECRRVTTEDGVQETARFPGLGNGLAGGKGLCMLLQECRLADVE